MLLRNECKKEKWKRKTEGEKWIDGIDGDIKTAGMSVLEVEDRDLCGGVRLDRLRV